MWTTGETPDDLQEVLITDYGDTNKIEDVEFSHWTAETFERLDYRGQIIFSEDNPYQVLPFIPIFDSLPVGSDFWLPGGEDLDLAQAAINVKLTDLLHILLHQSFGVGWIKGRVEDPLENDSESLLYGPGALVELAGKESGLGFESQKANISMIINSIDRLIKWTCVVPRALGSHDVDRRLIRVRTFEDLGQRRVERKEGRGQKSLEKL